MRRIHLSRSLWLLASLLGSSLIGASLLHAQQQPLTSVRAIRSLTPQAAAQHQPVLLNGVVTVLSGWKNSFFFRDSTSGISIDRLDDQLTAQPQLHSGQRVTVYGTTAAGGFAPLVQAGSITVQGTAPLPRAQLRTAEDLAGGQQDSQWLAIRGTVRSQQVRPIWGRNVLALNVDVGRGLVVSVRVHDFDPAHLPSLTGAIVRIAGVCGTLFNDRRQFVGVNLFTPSLASITVLSPAPGNPFALPLRPLDSLLQFNQFTSAQTLIRVGGTVTWQKPGVAFYLQSGRRGLFVEWKNGDTPALGTAVEAVGYPENGHGTAHLKAAFVRSAGKAESIIPLRVNAPTVISARDGFTATPAESLLVQIDGRLVDIVRGARQTTLLLENGHTLFPVRIASNPISVSPGAILRITGVCAIEYDDYTSEPSHFIIQIRSLNDVAILRPAPWWNANHSIRVAEILGFVVVLLLGIILLSRQATLRSLATTDSLTGLANRRTLLRHIDSARRSNLRSLQTLRLLFIDVDHFKQINDVHGHRRGDLALKQVAQLLRDAFPESHAIGRLGGDEFVVVILQTSREECEFRLGNALARSNSHPTSVVPLSLSTGILECGPTDTTGTAEDLLERADLLMYQQKCISRKHPIATPAHAALSPR